MVDISIGQVSAVIAAIFTVLQIFLPTALALLLVGMIRDEMTAVSWSSAGATLHASFWPTLLRSDSATYTNTQGSIKWLIRLGTLGLLIIFAASIVTPIGLYDIVEPNGFLQDVSFPYLADSGPFGFGTPPRSDLGFNRACGFFDRVVCPGSGTIEEQSDESVFSEFPFGYNTRLPTEKVELLQSGLVELEPTISSFFDIQFRTHAKAQDPDVNNGSVYSVGAFRMLGSLVLDNKVEAVEGLIVDMLRGGVAFRNHTIPSGVPLGATWTEELLVLTPETSCVDTNLTIDFTVTGSNGTLSGNAKDLVLTDRGGFANIARDLPEYNKAAPQIDPDLSTRAYQSAWFFNALLGIYFNVTRPNPDAFGYLESEVGKTFPIPSTTFLPTDQLIIGRYSELFSRYLAYDNDTSLGGTEDFPLWPNPFGITDTNFTDIIAECGGHAATSTSNMTKTAVGCGMVYGIPRLPDGSTRLSYDPDERLSMPLMSCASAVKVEVKQFSFRYNGTDLSSLHVDAINNRPESSPPLYWGVENNSDLDLDIRDVIPLWGLVHSSTSRTRSDLSVVESPHLYLPGYIDDLTMLTPFGIDNMPGASFPVDSLSSLYSGAAFSDQNFGFWTGKSSFAMFTQWQRLTSSLNGTANMVNLIYTDMAASGLVGTKSWLPDSGVDPASASARLAKRQSSSTATQTTQVPVRIFSRHVRYRLVYGIPGAIAAVFALLIGTTTLLFLCLGRTGPAKMRAYLNATSPGRLAAHISYPGESPAQAPTPQWSRDVGAKRVRIASPIWIPAAVDKASYHHAPPHSSGGGGGVSLAGYEHDAQPLIDDKTGVAIQMAPLGSGGGSPAPTNHNGYVHTFGRTYHAGQTGQTMQMDFPPPPNQMGPGSYPTAGYAR